MENPSHGLVFNLRNRWVQHVSFVEHIAGYVLNPLVFHRCEVERTPIAHPFCDLHHQSSLKTVYKLHICAYTYRLYDFCQLTRWYGVKLVVQARNQLENAVVKVQMLLNFLWCPETHGIVSRLSWKEGLTMNCWCFHPCHVECRLETLEQVLQRDRGEQ